MSESDITLDPVDHITVDALGKPGQRVFYLQGIKNDKTITILIEKFQLQSLLAGAIEFFRQIENQYPHLSKESVEIHEEAMHIYPPLDPLFRAGDMGLAYDEVRDLACVFARESSASGENQRMTRFWCSRRQLVAFVQWGNLIIERGRPICPQCGKPMEPEGHFCPKKNGHKRKK